MPSMMDNLVFLLEEHEAKIAKLKELLRDPDLAQIVSRLFSNVSSPSCDAVAAHPEPSQVRSPAPEPKERLHRPRTLRDAIRSLRPTLAKRFTTFEAFKEIETMQFKCIRKGGDLLTSVRAALAGLAEAGELKVVQKYAVGHPQVYEWVDRETDCAVAEIEKAALSE